MATAAASAPLVELAPAQQEFETATNSPARTPAKRKASSAVRSSGSSCEPRVSRVRFSHVEIREHALEIWGGGGVPADDGPPLGLSDTVTRQVVTSIDDFEEEREQERTPKDMYCVEGCMEPNLRRQMLLGSGCTQKQIRASTKAVAQLNQDRWKVRARAYSPEQDARARDRQRPARPARRARAPREDAPRARAPRPSPRAPAPPRGRRPRSSSATRGSSARRAATRAARCWRCSGSPRGAAST